jgi:hypothetical protein
MAKHKEAGVRLSRGMKWNSQLRSISEKIKKKVIWELFIRLSPSPVPTSVGREYK